MGSVTFRDETAAGRPLASFAVPDLPDRATGRELIRLRVREEVARHNAHPTGHVAGNAAGLVRPHDTETEPNAHRPGGLRRVDWERQAEIAEEAFTRNGFFVFVDNRQVDDLDEVVDLSTDPDIVFVRLVPLVGG